MSDLFYRQKRLLGLVLGIIFVAGLGALQTLERQEDPALSRRYADIVTIYPGATADRVESLVTEKIEARLQELHEIDTISSISRTGISTINVGLEDQYDEAVVDEIWSRVRDKLADVEADLPALASSPVFEDRTSTAVTLLMGFTWEGEGEPPLALLSRMAEELESQLRVLPGTKETQLYGEAVEELRVTVDPIRLTDTSLDANGLARAIANADTRRPAGRVVRDGSSLPIEVAGQLSSVERIRRVPIRSDALGRVLRVGDVATVEKTQIDPPATLAILSGQRGVALSATMLAGSGRVDRWAARGRSVIEAFRSELPKNVTLRILFDQSTYTDDRLTKLVSNLFLGIAIVVAVLFFMMGFRQALVVTAILPLTLLTVLIELKALDIPLHQISVTGLIIALGLLIDNAIVVVDEYSMRLNRGFAPQDAIREVVQDLLVPLGASTTTTVLAFLPIVLQDGPGGEFVGTIGLGVIFSVVTSFVLSMTLIVAFAGFAIRGKTSTDSRFAHGYSNDWLLAHYRTTLEAVLRRPILGVGVGVTLPLIGFLVAGSLPLQFFPANDRDQFQIQLDMPAHYPVAATAEAIERARAIVDAQPEVIESHWFAGESPPRVFYNMFGKYDIPSFGGAFVLTKSPTATERVLPRLQEELRRAIPEAFALALPFEQGPPFDAPIEVRIVGPEIETLRKIGDQVRAVLAGSEAVTYTRAKVLGGRPKLLLEANEDSALFAGLALGDVADQLNASLEGIVAGRIIDGTQDIPIRVRVGQDTRGSLSRIQSSRLRVTREQGATPDRMRERIDGVPVSSLGSVALVPELAAITRYNGQRVNTIQAFLEPYHLIQSSLDDFMARLEAADLALPAGYTLEFGGDVEQRTESMQELAAFAGPLFLMMAATIILTFNSFRFASIIFAVAFLSVGLAMLSIWVFGYPMGFVAIVGTMGLVGLAINDAIVVLNHLLLDERAATADVEATAEVVIDATRHILATTMTTIGGFFPLIIFGGRFWPPMATAIAGGVVGASILALYFVPSLFVVVRRRKPVERVQIDVDVARPATSGFLTNPQTR